MKKTFRFLTFASAALLLTACSDEDLLTPDQLREADPESNAIAFSTYMGKSGVTRAGYEGSIDNDALQASDKAHGFGVFAYYTGTNTYNDKNGASATLIPNFMYNEHVTYESSNWTYTNTKYWPNEVASGNVDDQDNDTGSDPATTAYGNGGNVTFFAYAPYVEVYTQADQYATAYTKEDKSKTLGLGDPKTTEKNGYTEAGTGDGKYYTKMSRGITAITPNTQMGDPKISYTIASDGKIVDLLWGTKGNTSENVLGTAQAGVTGTSTQAQPEASRTSYAGDLLKDMTTNADLTKQKTNGKVEFLFKHALAKVGGTRKVSDKISDNSGLLVQLDIDKDGSETGGEKGKNTVVTIKSIEITSGQVEYDSDNDGNTDATAYVTGGDFNLATGKWGTFQTSTSAKDAITHKITQASTDAGSNAVLNTSIAEPSSVTKMSIPEGGSDYYVNDDVPGVLTDRKNVYSDEANPFVFIPGTKPSFTITVDYIVRTFDSNLANTAPEGNGEGAEKGTWTKVEQVIKKNVAFTEAVQLNKMYSLVMHLGLTGVKFTAEVSNWDVDGDTDGNGQIDGEEVGLKDTYLPINVGEYAFPTENKTITINVPGTTTSQTLFISGLANSTEYTVSYSGTVTGDDFSGAGSFTTGAAETTKSIALTLAPNNGTKNITRIVTINQGSTTLTFNIVQSPNPLVAVLASPFNAELPNTGQTSASLLSTLKTAGGSDVATYTLEKPSDIIWITISGKNISVDAQDASNAPRSAIITIKASDTDETATTTVTISQAAGSSYATP